jgi:hypothetical protein
MEGAVEGATLIMGRLMAFTVFSDRPGHLPRTDHISERDPRITQAPI